MFIDIVLQSCCFGNVDRVMCVVGKNVWYFIFNYGVLWVVFLFDGPIPILS